jgi:hypothetical protein
MKTVRFSKRFFIPGVVLLLLCAFILASSNLSYTQQTIKRTISPRKLMLKNDLTIKIVQCPKKVVKAGEELKAGFQVVGKSTFAGPVNSVVVDLILTSKPTYPAPAPLAVYSANYSDNVLLKGGRENISFTGPGSVNVPLNGTNTIPADTPTGIYYLGAVIDAGNKVRESSERNNVHFCRLKVVGSETKDDLTIKIVRCPKKVVKAGEELNAGFKVVGKSTFAGPVNSVAVDIILTSKPTYPIPAPFAVYSANYSDNVLLKGGREHISFTGPGNVNVKLNGTNTIPADTPTGIYYLGAVIDAGNKVKESNERNNVHFCKLKVIGSDTKRMPDLIISSIVFKKVTQRYDAKKQPYWIFNVIITVKNQGNANAGPFKVLLERNVGPGGSFTQACQTCVIGVQGLGAGQYITLPPRQFNNANNMNSKFRATADISNTVTESSETNNRKIASF